MRHPVSPPRSPARASAGSPSHSRLANATRLATALRALGREMAAHERDVAAPLGLSPVQSQALQAVAAGGPLSMAALAEHLCIAPSTTTRLVDQLERKGWVTRQPDPADRRRAVVGLTPAGSSLAEEVHAYGIQAMWEGLRHLPDPPASLKAVEQLLGMLRESAGEG